MTAKELAALLIIQLGLPPAYVWDEMEMYEAEAYATNLQYRNKEQWEMTRFLAYITANSMPFRKKEVKMHDIMTFSWEDKEKEQAPQATPEQLEKLKAKAAKIEKLLNKQHG